MKKTLNLLAALMLTFTFAACSFFEKPATGGSKISIALDKAAVARIRSTSASIARAIDNTSGDYYFTVSLQGDYQDEQTVPVTEEAKITFKAVPVGKTISDQAQVYLAYTGEDGNEVKEYLYTGTSEELTVAEGENPLTINLQKYVAPCNTVIKTATKFIAINPTFTVEHDGRALATNKLEFNYQANDETMVWKLDNLSDYQKAIVTFKGDVLKTDEDNVLAFKVVKKSTGAIYFLNQVEVTAESKTYEFLIPQYIGLDQIGIENKWDVNANNGEGRWSKDFSCFIERIELIKDSTLIDPDFNVVTQTSSTYTVKNPAVQKIQSTGINKNSITFDSTQGRYETGSGYSAAYWEFADLEQYETISIKVKANDPNDFKAIKIILKGYSPFNYPVVTECQNGTDIKKVIDSPNVSQTFEFELSDFKAGIDEGRLTAIQFQNDSYSGEWVGSSDEALDYGEPWTLQIEEIQLSRTDYSGNVNIYVDQANGQVFNSESYRTGSKFKPFKYVSDAIERIKADGTPQTQWTILIKGEATGTPTGTGAAPEYGPVEIPSDLTSDMAKSILITGATPHSDWLDKTVPSDLDTLNRGSNGDYNGSSTSTALTVNTTVPVTITNLKITGGTASNGGALLVAEGATVSLGDGNLLTGNRASKGGAIFNKGTLFIYGSTVIGDKDATTYANYSSTQNLSSHEAANYAGAGGGIFNGDPSATTYANASFVAKLYLGYKPSGDDLTPVFQEFTGGIYFNGSAEGGGIKNSIKSEIYMNSGTIQYNGISGKGAGIYNDEGGIIYMSGGSIANNRATYQSSVVNGGGICNDYSRSKFIMSGGSIYNNIAWCNSGGSTNGKGGGVYNGGVMFMYGTAVIGEDPTKRETPSYDPADSDNYSNKANLGGGIYNGENTGDQPGKLYIGYEPDTDLITPIPHELTGGIYYNYSEQVYSMTSKWGGGGIYNNATSGYGEFRMSSGTIAYNATNDYGGGLWNAIGKLCNEDEGQISIHDNLAINAGGAVYISPSSRNELILGGSIEIPAGEYNVHDIYVGASSETYYSTIQIDASLDGSFEALITPGLYSAGLPLIKLTTEYSSSLGSSAAEQLEAELTCFSVTTQTTGSDGNLLQNPVAWRFDSTGKLEQGSTVTVSDYVATAITHTSGEFNFVLDGVDPTLSYVYLKLFSREDGGDWEEEDADEGHNYQSGTIENEDPLTNHFFKIFGVNSERTEFKIVFFDNNDNAIAEYPFTITD